MAKDYRDMSLAEFVPATETEFAQWQIKHGRKVLLHRGHYWTEMMRGFYQPINYMARLKFKELSRPTPFCFGFRTSLCEADVPRANSGIPMNMLSNPAEYTLEKLPAKRRSDLRKCEKLVSFVQLVGPGLLREQGYAVDLSAHLRNGHGARPEAQHYEQDFPIWFPERPFVTILAGLVGEKLAGYIVAHAIDDTVIIDLVNIATEHLNTAIGTGLIYNLVQLCKKGGTLKHIIYGLHSIENPKLVAFKEGMGFKTVIIPSYLWIIPGIKFIIQKKRKYVYYRLTGVAPSDLQLEPETT